MDFMDTLHQQILKHLQGIMNHSLLLVTCIHTNLHPNNSIKKLVIHKNWPPQGLMISQ